LGTSQSYVKISSTYGQFSTRLYTLGFTTRAIQAFGKFFRHSRRSDVVITTSPISSNRTISSRSIRERLIAAALVRIPLSRKKSSPQNRTPAGDVNQQRARRMARRGKLRILLMKSANKF
jgi:hypothetical protein